MSVKPAPHIIEALMDVKDTIIQTACIVRIDDVVKHLRASAAMTEIHHFRIKQRINFWQKLSSLKVY